MEQLVTGAGVLNRNQVDHSVDTLLNLSHRWCESRRAVTEVEDEGCEPSVPFLPWAIVTPLVRSRHCRPKVTPSQQSNHPRLDINMSIMNWPFAINVDFFQQRSKDAAAKSVNATSRNITYHLGPPEWTAECSWGRNDLLFWLPVMTEDETSDGGSSVANAQRALVPLDLTFPSSSMTKRTLLFPAWAYLHISVKLCMMLTHRGSFGGRTPSKVASMDGRPNKTRYFT